MKGTRHRAHWLILALSVLSRLALAEDDAAPPPPVELVVSVAEQKLALVEGGGLVKKYPISTSKFGLGDSYNSYKTPVGRLRICDKIGGDLPLGSVIKHRNATGEILPANASGRDPIVTRILWLDGEEAQNRNAKARGIYIHGTVEESRLGEPVSYGCIRMRSKDVTEVFADVPVGTPVRIITEKFPRFRKPTPPKPEVLFADSDNNKPTTVTRDTPHGTITVALNRPMFAPDPAKPETKLDATPEGKPATPTKLVASKSAKPEPEAPRMVLFGESSPVQETAAPKKLVAAKTPEAKTPAASPALPPPVASGPVVQLGQPRGTPSPLRTRLEPIAEGPQIETASRLSEPMHHAMQSSILLAGLPSLPAPVAAAPLPVEKATKPALAAAPAPVVTRPAAAPSSPLSALALRTVGTDLLFGMLYLSRLELPPDLFTTHLLEARVPDEPRLAFRTTLPTVKHPVLP